MWFFFGWFLVPPQQSQKEIYVVYPLICCCCFFLKVIWMIWKIDVFYDDPFSQHSASGGAGPRCMVGKWGMWHGWHVWWQTMIGTMIETLIVWSGMSIKPPKKVASNLCPHSLRTTHNISKKWFWGAALLMGIPFELGDDLGTLIGCRWQLCKKNCDAWGWSLRSGG